LNIARIRIQYIFKNGGLMRRQGFEAYIAMRSGPLRATIGYSFIDATFESALALIGKPDLGRGGLPLRLFRRPKTSRSRSLA
jgi:hypothetical protein